MTLVYLLIASLGTVLPPNTHPTTQLLHTSSQPGACPAFSLHIRPPTPSRESPAKPFCPPSLKGRTGLFLLCALTVFCKWPTWCMNHCSSIHKYVMCKALWSKLWGPTGELISFLTPSAYSAGLSGEEDCNFSFSHLCTCLLGPLLQPDSVPDQQEQFPKSLQNENLWKFN